MTRVPGAGTASLVMLAIAVMIWSAGATTLLAANQDASAPVEIGAGPVREQALALVGRNVYQSDSVTLGGYLTAVLGLDPASLFTDGPPSAQTARFTYAGSVSLSSSTNRGDVTAFSGEGVLRIYFDDDAGASWDDPDSFAAGQPVAEFSLVLRDTLQRQAPGVGVIVGDERLRQDTAEAFTIDGASYRFGQTGIEARLRFAGALASGDATTPSPGLLANVTGAASVTARESNPIRMGGPGAASSATPAAAGCPSLQPWLTQATGGLERARSLGATAGEGASASLDVDATLQAAADVAALAETQRRIEAPDSAAATNRLVVTALSTYARGLQTVADAAAAGDDDALALGRAALADGDQLQSRAMAAIAELDAVCAES